ncbi:MAG: phosphate/phosphite/phosphonate ABC transporter substrate-binding protein [Anaerolineales bacterium]
MGKIAPNPHRQVTRIVLLLAGMFLAACAPAKETPVDLKQLYPLASPASREVIPLQVGVAAVISPQGTLESYRELINYMEQRLGRPVEMVQRANYDEINRLLETGQVEVAFVCTGAYIYGWREFGMEVLVAPEIDGAMTYASWLIVPADSPAQDLADLRGMTFAFTDPLSFTGRMYPTYLVNQLGESPASFFGRVFYTYSHDAAIEAVADGLADGAAVDNLIYQYLMQREPELGGLLRIIHRSPPFGMPPVVVSPSIRPQLKAELLELFLHMDDDPAGAAALDILGIDRFREIDASAYDTVLEVESSLEENGDLAP